MIEVRVLAVKPHPDQATNNPGSWAVQFQISYNGHKRTFWRWHTVRDLSSIKASTPTTSTKKPTANEIILKFWDDTFAELHGFDFQRFQED